MIDGAVRYDVTESILETGIPSVRNPIFEVSAGRGGHFYSFYPIGHSLTALPFVYLGAALGNGSLEAKQFAFSLTTIPFAAGAVSLLFLIYGRLGCTPRRALTWALVVAFCTLLWPYAGSTFDSAIQAFWLTLAVWGALEAIAAHTLRWSAVSGIAFAMLINLQEFYVVLGACVLAGAPLTWATLGRRLQSRVVHVMLLGVVAGTLLVLAYNLLKFGNPLDTGRTAAPHPFIGNPLRGFAGLAISPAKSVFLYAPPYAMAMIGLRRLFRRSPDLFAPVIACVVIHVALISTLRFWAGEWAWGPRYLVASLPLACIGLPFAWEAATRRHVALGLCTLGLVVQLLAISVDHQRYYLQRSLSPYFWTDDAIMYTDSPLLARPFEVMAVWDGSERAAARALVPNLLPLSMTSVILGPPPVLLPYASEWMRRYMVFSLPRPWTLWSRFLADGQKPGPTGVMTMAGLAVALASFGGLALVLRSAPPDEQQAQEK